MIGDQGASTLAAILKETKITSLGCAATRVFAFLSAPIDTATPHLCSLDRNMLCGLDFMGEGTYTSEGITKLCEALKGSAVTSLECAAAPECSLSCQRPLTRLYSLTVSHPAPRSQARRQQHRSRGRHCARRHP
jgi:hypothetical protein